jgi:sulfite reductase beta subunit-like hemoprotein
MGRFSLGRDSNPMNPTGSLHFLRLKVSGGLLTAEQLLGVADLAEEYGRSRAEITNRQDLQLHWIDAEDALEIFSRMDELGFTTDMCGQSFSGARYGDARNVVCCPVSGIDQDELLNGYPLMKEMSQFFIGNPDFQDMPKKFKFSISGCRFDCTRAITNDLSFVAVKNILLWSEEVWVRHYQVLY